MGHRVLIAVSDLLFQTRVEGAVSALGFETLIADTPAQLDDALQQQPTVAVVDVHETAFPAIDAITRASEAGARVLAFGRHTAPADLRRARDAGAAIVVPRSELVGRLAELVERLVSGLDVGGVARDPASL